MNRKKFRERFLSVILAVAMLVTLFPVSAFAAEPDTTPPAFSPGYPRAGSLQTAGSRQIRVVIGAQEASYYSYVLLPDGAAAPTKEQVVAGKDANSSPALSARSSGATKYTSVDTGTYAPLHGTAYDIYVVLRDDTGNISEPVKVDVTTPPAADFFAAGYPAAEAAQPLGSKQVQVLVKIRNTQVDGKVFYTLVPDGDPAPTIEQIRDGKGGGGEPPVSSGSVTAAKGSECSILVSGDADASAYDLYLVAGDTYYASPLGVCTDIVKLDVTTPAAALPNVCAIGGAQFTSLGDALAAVQSGQTISLLADINYHSGIVIDGKSVTFGLNGFTLNVDNPDSYALNGAGLEVLNGGGVFLTGDGELNVTGKHYGVSVTSNTLMTAATVTNATATDPDGTGAYAYNKASLTVLGNATATGVRGIGVHALQHATITVKGNAAGTKCGACASFSTITVEKDAIGNGIDPIVGLSVGIGVEAYEGDVTVLGNVIANNTGAWAIAGGNIIINGSITAPCYITLGDTVKGINEYDAVTSREGYHTYSYKDTFHTTSVWVKENLSFVYALTVENGTGGGSYAAGTPVNITADAAPSGKVFDHWAAVSGGTFADAASASTIFIMPAAAATVTAVYRDQNTPPPAGNIITASAGNGGSISPHGAISVNRGGSRSFAIMPNAGYRIASVTVDGVSQGAVSSYTFHNVTANHTISAAFLRTDGSGADQYVQSRYIVHYNDRVTVDLTKGSSILSAAQINTLIGLNRLKPVILNGDGYTITFPAGAMHVVSGQTDYDFGIGFNAGANYSSIRSLAGNSSVMMLNFYHSGALPGEAQISIHVGSQFAGKTLYYYFYNTQSGKPELIQKTKVDENGWILVTQNHCSDYVLTSDEIRTQDFQKNPGTGNSGSRDNLWWIIGGIPISSAVMLMIRKMHKSKDFCVIDRNE